MTRSFRSRLMISSFHVQSLRLTSFFPSLPPHQPTNQAMSPDGESIVTGAGDETLRFWNVFNKTRSQKEAKSVLNLFSSIR